MGVTHVTVAVRNPDQPDKFWEGLLLVDTGSIDCLVPGNRLREIGIEPEGQRTFELGDGSEAKFDIAVAKLEFMGKFVGATVNFGKDSAEPILG